MWTVFLQRRADKQSEPSDRGKNLMVRVCLRDQIKASVRREFLELNTTERLASLLS